MPLSCWNVQAWQRAEGNSTNSNPTKRDVHLFKDWRSRRWSRNTSQKEGWQSWCVWSMPFVHLGRRLLPWRCLTGSCARGRGHVCVGVLNGRHNMWGALAPSWRWPLWGVLLLGSLGERMRLMHRQSGESLEGVFEIEFLNDLHISNSIPQIARCFLSPTIWDAAV